MAELVNEFIDRAAFDSDIAYADSGFSKMEKRIESINSKGITLELDFKGGDIKSLDEFVNKFNALRGYNDEFLKQTKNLEQANLLRAKSETEASKQATEASKKERLEKQTGLIEDRKRAADAKVALADYNKTVKEGQKELDTLAKQYQAVIQKGIEREAQLQKEAAADDAFQRTIEKNAAKNAASAEKWADKQAKEAADASNAYKQLAKEYISARDEARQYALTLGPLSSLTLEAAKNANTLNNKLKNVDQMTGEFGRSVGNYNGVGAQFNQLLRELPNLAQSPQIFIMALSNNISYFAESVSKARKDGESWKQILTTLGTSTFGLVGIVNIAVTAFTFLSNAFLRSGEKAKEAKSEIEAYRETLKRLHDEEDRRIEKRNTDNGMGEADAKRALELARAQSKGTAADLKKIEVAENAYLDRKRERLERERDFYKKQADNAFAYPIYDKQGNDVTGKPGYQHENPDQVNYNKSLEAIKDLDNERLVNAAATDAKISKIHEDNTIALEKRLKEAITKSDLEYAKSSLETDKKAQQDIIAVENVRIDKTTQDEEASYKVRAAARYKYYADVLALLQLEHNAAMQNNADENKANVEEINSKKTSEANKNKLLLLEHERFTKEKKRIDEDYTQAQATALGAYATDSIKDTKETNDRIEKEERDSQKRRFEGWTAFWAGIKKGAEEAAIAQNQYSQRMIAVYAEMFNSFLSIGKAIGSGVYDAQLSKQNDIIKNIDLQKQLEIDRINATAATDIEARQQIAIVDAQALLDTKKAEDEKRRLSIQRASLNKAISIAEIIARTALAVITALTTYPPTPLNAAMAVAAGITGAAALAAAIAAPLPGYHAGIDNSPEGFAKVGEKGREMRIDPDGRISMTPSSETVTYLDKGTSIIPNAETEAILNMLQISSLNESFSNRSNKRAESILANVFTKASERSASRIVDAIHESSKTDFSNFYQGYYTDKFKN